MAIVWPCTMTPHEYAAVGRDIEVPRPNCPACSLAMSFWGFYARPLRVGVELRLLIRRARCKHCQVSCGIVPDFVVPGRLDGVEVIGAGIEEMAAGATTATAATRFDVPYTTVRSWRRRFAERAGILSAGFLAATVALCAIEAAERAMRRRLGATAGHWRIANYIVGGHLLSTNSNPPWISS
ncbi:MAG: DUF6431 domain-containing protein [Actinomycetota bacterium]|nr:DUF6431 domain-containing protein [Actinomycetota bacterium]